MSPAATGALLALAAIGIAYLIAYLVDKFQGDRK